MGVGKIPLELEQKILSRSTPPVGVNLPVVRLDVAAAAHPGQRVSLTLPYPPSVNHYWRHAGDHAVLLSKEGRQYRKAVLSVVQAVGVRPLGTMRLSVFLSVFPPDKRRRDIDNTPKGLLDALTHAGLWDDDEQIDHLSISRRDVVAGGRVEVLIIPRKEVPQ